MVDSGIYNKNQDDYHKLVLEMHEKYSDGVKLPAEYAHFFDTSMINVLIRLARYKFIAREIKKSDNILEVGCGSGVGSIFLSQFANRVTGIDIKQSEIDDANRINSRSNISFIQGDFFDYQFKNKFDVIVNLDVIEHLNDDETIKLLSKLASLTDDYGFVVIGTPSYYSWNYQSPLSQASHIKCYDLPDLVSIVEKYFHRTLTFSMNDEIVHTGYHKMAWYYFVLAFYPKKGNK